MFDLFRSRQKAVRYILGALLLMVGLSMVITLIPGYGTSSARSAADETTVAEIGSEKVSAQEVIQTAQRFFRGNQIPPEMLEVYLPQFVERMVLQRAVVYEFERLGLTVSDDDILRGMAAAYPSFFPNGQLISKEQLEAALAQQGQTLQDAVDATRQNLILTKVQNLEYVSTIVSPKEVDDELARKYEKSKVKYIAFPPAKFRDQVKVTPEEIKAHFDAHRFDYTEPQKRAFQVLVVDQDKVEASLTISDKQLHDAYAASMDNFRMPERVHVRHILLKTVDKSDAEKKQLLSKAQDILKQLKGGADFAELAKKDSQDTGSAEKGGDLGWIVRDQTLPEFNKAVFTLKPKELSEVVTTSVGYHIIQVLEREPARVKPFDEVKDSLAADLKKQGLTEKMQSIGDQVRAALAKSPGSAAEIAKQFNVELVTVPKAGPGEAIPMLGVSPEVDNALASLKKNDVSPVLVLPANRLAVVVLNEDFPAHPSEFKDVEDKVRDRVISDKAQLIAEAQAKDAAEKLKAGANMDTLAKSLKLPVTESIEFNHTDSVEGLGGAVQIPDVFTKPVGSFLGPMKLQDRQVVIQIVEQKAIDPAQLSQERETILAQLKQKKGITDNDLFMDSVLDKLVAEGKVKIHRDVVKRLTGSVR
jgi:peptidyl-prolyl cis-trans isomerase D